MKEAIVSAGPRVKFVDSSMPKVGPDQLLLKVVVAAANPKDWKLPEWTGVEIDQGDEGAGIVEAVGENVLGFKPGDRVAGLHTMGTPGGLFTEYGLLQSWTTFHIGKDTSFEEAATIPLTAGTAAAGLFGRVGGLGLPMPMQPATEPLPLVIYGASGSVGTFALQLAKKANIHPIICVAGGGAAKQVEPLLEREKGDTIVNYREGDTKVVEGIKAALKGTPLKHALDTVAQKSSSANIAGAMTQGGKIARTLPPERALGSGIEQISTNLATLHAGEKDLGFTMFQLFGRGLQQGWLSPRPYEVVPGGIDGVEKALSDLKAGKASAVKYVLRIADAKSVS